ncbi:DUF1549 domain-containing protein [Novipirellula artificiosorum]|uniref:Planctomycete cytochrome C n=1 Tax=Novipirellula artificiosorum TaxID=2528016 RepID=A0A5C6DX56_9BACT|nr:DUF1549 domain-containing protein [Novipirellula artificiosorum]TWU40794.1 Planctomycete cytochrome C [Novipirellula artificiosorum]
MMKVVVYSLLIVFLWPAVSHADARVNDDAIRFFESEVRPLLADQCWDCHGEKDQKGDLRLDSMSAILRGGETGPALVVGKPGESLLVEAIRYESFEMPPSGPLPAEQAAILTKWISIGAPWPDSDRTVQPRESSELFSLEDRAWWAFQAVQAPDVPNFGDSDWPRNEIDGFILAQMRSAGLSPSPQADPTTLVRRLYFDVIGLPPTPDQVRAFVRDTSPTAYEDLVDTLLDAPEHGQHAARKWLDLVRYADSDGYRADGYRPNAWRYRDYVIASFNADKPYDRFIQEQIAGDELFPEDLDAQVALGYLRHWVYEWNIRDASGQWNTILDDITDTTADVFMGLGLQCAKCHNHKFDPLLQKDYFRLRAFFAPIQPKDITLATRDEIKKHHGLKKAWESKVTPILAEVEELEAPYRATLRDRAINRFPEDMQLIARMPAAERTPLQQQLADLVMLQVEAEYKTLESEMEADDKERRLQLQRDLEKADAEKPADLPVAMSVRDVGPVAPPTTLPKRPGAPLEPGFPSVLDQKPMVIRPLGQSTGRRAALARWLTDPANPLTSRVMVNRIWQTHFGRGLAANTSDLGRLGEAPSHPKLLDWIANQFIASKWSLKTLHRMILTSATYRQSTQHPQQRAYQLIDPSNQYYWRSDTRRLSAEQIRDAMLVVSDQYSDQAGGPGVLSDLPKRSIFTRVMRNSSDELLGSFDLPLFFSSTPSRNTTTTPVQSLLMINSDLVLGHARRLAAAVSIDSDELCNRISRAWWRVYGRAPTEAEAEQALRFVRSQTTQLKKIQADASPTVIETAKLPYREGQAVQFKVDQLDLQLAAVETERMDLTDFTIEMFFQLRSIDDHAAVRTLAAKWNGSSRSPGWGFGVTGHGSRRKPQTLVLQIVGDRGDGKISEQAIFSDHHVEMNKPYYAAACVRLAKSGEPGVVTFHLKDLSNDDQPLLTLETPHDARGGFANQQSFTIGGVDGGNRRAFDGLIDDVRLLPSALTVDQLLYTAERDVQGMIGYWQFETDPGVLRNRLESGPDLEAKGNAIIQLDPSETALVDFCHALLNSNEFLYVH